MEWWRCNGYGSGLLGVRNTQQISYNPQAAVWGMYLLSLVKQLIYLIINQSKNEGEEENEKFHSGK